MNSCNGSAPAMGCERPLPASFILASMPEGPALDLVALAETGALEARVIKLCQYDRRDGADDERRRRQHVEIGQRASRIASVTTCNRRLPLPPRMLVCLQTKWPKTNRPCGNASTSGHWTRIHEISAIFHLQISWSLSRWRLARHGARLFQRSRDAFHAAEPRPVSHCR